MDFLTKSLGEQSIAWLLLSQAVLVVGGLIASWLAYRVIDRPKLIKTVESNIEEKRQSLAMEEAYNQRENIRKEVARWANPILDSVRSLEGRLNNILHSNGYLALSEKNVKQVDPQWAISYDYFMNSTLYLFGQYFAWVRILEEQLNHNVFHSQRVQDDFYKAIIKVSDSLGDFPMKDEQTLESIECSGNDTQLFRLQQRAIGELLILREENLVRCMSYPVFLRRMKKDEFEYSLHLKSLRDLLEGLNPHNEDSCRWERLTRTCNALADLKNRCELVLKPPEGEGDTR